MTRALLRRLEAIEAMLGATEEPVAITLDGRVIDALHDGERQLPAQAFRGSSSVRMVQIDPDGTHKVLEIGPAPGGGGGTGRMTRRPRNGRGRRPPKNSK